MAHRAGLHQVKKSVRSKSGKTIQRSYWVKGTEAAKAAGGKIKGAARAAGGFLNRHKGKIAAGVGLAAAAYGAHKGHQLFKAGKGLGLSRSGTVKAALSGLKDRAKGAAERGAHAVVGAGAKAHKYASEFRGKRAAQKEHRAAASGAAMPSVGERAKAAVGNAGKRIRSAAAGVKSAVGRRKSSKQLGSGS